MMSYLLLFLIFIFCAVFLLDVIPQFNTWQSRIHIGRFRNKQIWEAKLLQTSKKWLKILPTIKLTDQTRLVFIDVLRGNYKRTAIQSWQEGALVLGLNQYVQVKNNEEIRQEILNFLNQKMSISGHWKIKPTETDHSLLAYAFLQSNLIDHHKYKPAFDETYQMILSLKGQDGTVAYKKYSPEYRFVDTIGFICPFLVTYGMKFNIPEAIELAVKQITEFRNYGMMNTLNIPCHTYNIDTKIPTGLFGWGRGTGWWVIGLIDSWSELPENHASKKELKEIIIKTAISIFSLQNENGSFPWLLFNPKSRADSSATATLAWFFTLAAEIPEIKIQCDRAKEKCLTYLQSVTRRDGTVDFSQGDTKGIGVYSMNFDRLPFTQGFLLRTFSK